MIRMKIKTRVLPADEAGVAEAAQLLRQGQLVALHTKRQVYAYMRKNE